MAPLRVPLNWPPLGPMIPEDKEADLTGGHPTVPGDLDVSRRLRRQGLPSPGNGQPGRPRWKSLGPRHGHGTPADGIGRPTTPGVVYEGSEEGGYVK